MTDEDRGSSGPASDDNIEVADGESPPDSDVSVRTTASRASKRTKGRRMKSGKRSRAASPVSILSDAEEDEPREFRGKGRPPTTGLGVLCREIKAKKAELQRVNEEVEAAKDILDGRFDIRAHRQKMAARDLELEEELRFAPSGDIAARLNEASNRVAAVAATSKNLKGTCQKALNEAASDFRVGVDALSMRVK